ncbi:phosphatidylinositol-specific phospholipase C/glycerophosphodiester phosphodiesterase family protein [Sinomonas halotolerans]|uniref:Altered inheritance of mitochondria protein 6 n=1 Tax=Sinomonas halotolerans TaxID=1644133 RepID=A0ABU9WY20_9MICC
MKTLAAVLLTLATAGLTTAPAQAVTPAGHVHTDAVLGTPLEQAHAHNDYEHARPLFDALGHGFTSVEADVWLVDGELLVAHDREDVKPGRTLESLYLEPLEDLVHHNGHSVYPGWDGTFQLLIDIKSDAETTYAAVEEALADHPSILTRYTHGESIPGPVQAVVSGNRPLATMAAAERRFGFYDGRATDLAAGPAPELMPLVSNNWTKLFTWQGVGPMPAAERERLHAYVDLAHSKGYAVRFWATNDVPGPARDALWTELLDAGVDHINTDDLAGLEAFLKAHAA